MKLFPRLFLLVSLIGFTTGCSFHSYESTLTEIKIPHYRKPDSLKVMNEESSMASMLWQDYYRDKNLSALIDSALNRNLSLYSSILQMEKADSYIRKAFDYSRELYQKNTATYLDVLAAQSQLLQTRLDMADSFVNYYSHRIELYKALGGGSLL